MRSYALLVCLSEYLSPFSHIFSIPQAYMPGAPAFDDDELCINPRTGEEAARRWHGDMTQGWHTIMPLLYRLVYELAPGDVGELAFGHAALIWAVAVAVADAARVCLASRAVQSARGA
jgi:hypothetical protein